MRAPQIILIVLEATSLLLIASKHGKPREDKYNVFYSLITCGIVVGLLIWGGFFK